VGVCERCDSKGDSGEWPFGAQGELAVDGEKAWERQTRIREEESLA
jgi:hypothetical protein